MQHYSGDTPILLKNEDRFQRYDFAKRIAQTIISRDDNNGIVIGIYGAWGEGKTSVLNFIEENLKVDNCIPIRFNPWRYNGEDELLKQFFETIASALKAEVLTKKEKRGAWLKKISPFAKAVKLPILDIGDILNNIASALNSLGIEKLKGRINELLKEKQRKIVIFIDDIDRLNKEEIHAIFRLVKLNADFINTTYILSFDEAMVAAAIGNRFGEGNSKAGLEFLEKIVQVRLTLPKIQRTALREFQFELINRVIEQTRFDINEKNTSKFVREFDGLLLKLKTPRQAVQFANSISFSLPLLYGEVDTADLMLIEGVKVFYPNFYEFIKNEPEYFVRGYDSHNLNREEKIKKIKEHFKELSHDLTVKEEHAVKELLLALFPLLKEAFENYSFGERHFSEWYKQKQICSPQYFERYFSYCVIKGQLSDIAFKELQDQLSLEDSFAITALVQKMIEQSSESSFLDKIYVYEDEYSWKEGCSLISGILQNSESLSTNDRKVFKMPFETGQGRAAMWIEKFFKKYRHIVASKERLAFAEKILDINMSYDFKFKLLESIGNNTESRMVFDFQDVLLVHAYYRKLVLSYVKNEPIYKILPGQFFRISFFWGESNKEELNDYTRQTLNENKQHIVDFLKSCSGFIYSSTNPEGYQTDLSQDFFTHLQNYFDIELIKIKIEELFAKEELDKEEVIWVGNDGGQTNMNVARQFLFWYNKDKSLISSDAVDSH